MNVNRETRSKGRVRIFVTSVGVVLLLMTVLCLCACNHSESADGGAWPQGGLLDMVPVGAGTCLDTFENADDAYVSFKGDEERFKSYLDECSQMGFTVDTKLNGHNYDAYDSEGYSVQIVYFDSGKDAPFVSVHLYRPKASGALNWPTQGSAALLPSPNKAKGSISIDDSEHFTAYVGEMSREEYDAYVEDCMKKGFNVDYSKGESFYAKDSKGNELALRYEGFQTMYVDLSVASGTSGAASGDVPALKKEESASQKENVSPDSPSRKDEKTSKSDSGSKLNKDDIEKVAVTELYARLQELAEIYTNLEPGSCKYKIGSIERSSILDEWEVNGTVYYVDKFGSSMKCTGGYSMSFTVYVDDYGNATCNGF